MIRLNDIVLLLIEAVGHDNFIRILLSVNGMLLKSDIDFAEVHRRRICPQLLPESELIGIFHGPDLLSFKVRELPDSLVRGHDAEPLIRISQEFKSRFPVRLLHLFQEFRLIHCLPDRLDVAEDTGRVEHCRIVDKADLRRCVLDHKRDIPVITALQKFPVSAKHTVGIDRDLDPSFAEAVHFLNELFRIDLGHCVLRARRSQRIRVPLLSNLPGGASRQNSGRGKHHSSRKNIFLSHNCLLPYKPAVTAAPG